MPPGYARKPQYARKNGKGKYWSCKALDGLCDPEEAAVVADDYTYIAYYANAASPPHDLRPGNTSAMAILIPNELAKELQDEATKEPFAAEIVFQRLFPGATGSGENTNIRRFKVKYLDIIGEEEWALLQCKKCRETIFDGPKEKIPSEKMQCPKCNASNSASDAGVHLKTGERRRIVFPEPVGEVDSPETHHI